jgi:chromosome segregation ATPase
LAQQKGKAEKAEEHEKQAALLSKQLLLEKSNLETLTAELRREQQKLQQKQTFVQQLKKEKDEAERKARSSAFFYSEGLPLIERSLNAKSPLCILISMISVCTKGFCTQHDK